MGLSVSTIKCILLVLNCLFMLLGLLVIFVGISYVLIADHIELNHGKNFFVAIIVIVFSSIAKVIGGIIITAGAILSIFSILGCWTAIRETKTNLLIYISALTVFIVVELLLIFTKTGSQQTNASDSVNAKFDQFWLNDPDALAEIENMLQCCGVNSAEDYRSIGHEIPNTCCKYQNCTIPENIYQEGCRSKYKEQTNDRSSLFSIITILLILVEVIAFIFSWLLYINLNNEIRLREL